MTKPITYWLDWKAKLIKPSSEGLQVIPWADIEKHPITVYCDQNTWPYLEIQEQEKQLITNEEKRTYQVGLATIKELRGATEANPEGLGTQALKKCWELCPNFVSEHPSHDKELFQALEGWVYPPRFENLQSGTFKEVWGIDIKSCYGKIMRDYPLPYGNPEHLTNSNLIEQALQEGKTGFIGFYLTNYAIIKNNQIPFLPNSKGEINFQLKGRLLLHSRLFNTFCKKYKLRGKIIYNDFWIFKERKGDINLFLDYCEELKKTDKKQGKMLVNCFYGAVGKKEFRGYNYRAWTLAINHLAILQTYYLYRQFQPEQVLAIRSDCIYIQGELPPKLNKELYYLKHYNLVSFRGKDDIFIHDVNELKSFTSGKIREELIKELK